MDIIRNQKIIGMTDNYHVTYFNTVYTLCFKYEQCHAAVQLDSGLYLRCIKKQGHAGLHKAISYDTWEVVEWNNYTLKVTDKS